MFISLYNEDVNHIANIDNVSYDLTTRVYDNDNFSAEGVSGEDINNAKIAVLNDDEGLYKYACFVDSVKSENKKQTIKGIDFNTLWDTEILLDYTAEGSFNGKLSAIFTKIKDLVFNQPDATINKIPVEVVIPQDNTDTTEMYGSYQGTYQITNAYKFLKCYLKYYEYNIESCFDVSENKIVFTFVKCNTTISINLSDFIYELTTSSSTTNKAVATIKYDIKTEEMDADGNTIYTNIQAKDEQGNLLFNSDGSPQFVPKYKARPNTIATIYYYRDKNNNIVQSNEQGNVIDRIYPVRTKIFESEYLADAQFDAVYELANSRYVDNIQIDNNFVIDPIDFSVYPLYTKVDLYYEGVLYKTLPISEKTTKHNGNGTNINIKLGFKKILLTEIIKN